MTKKKRKFHSEVVEQTMLQLSKTASMSDKRSEHNNSNDAKKPIFSPELINRLTERIKKL